MKKFPNFLPNLNQAISRLNQTESGSEARVRFTINEMLFHCLGNLKFYKVICYSIVEVGFVTKKLDSFS